MAVKQQLDANYHFSRCRLDIAESFYSLSQSHWDKLDMKCSLSANMCFPQSDLPGVLLK